MIASKFFHRRMIPVFHRLLVPTLTIGVARAAPPVAYDDLIMVKADTQATLDYLVLNDKDADGNTLTITATTSPAHGTLTALGGNSYRYTPTAGYAGRDTFTYTVSDGTGGTDTALVTVSVNAAYDVTAARDAILAGVTQLADVAGNRVASAWGPTAASISNYRGQDETSPMVTAATMGGGRIVVMADPDWLDMNTLGEQYTTSTFYRNSISWIANTTSKTIPILTMSSEVSTWLAAQGYTNVTTATTTNLAAALPGKTLFIPGMIPRSLSAANITAVKNFIQAGGGLFCCEGTYTANATETILREAGISIDVGTTAGTPFTINRADSLLTTDVITAIFQNPSGYPDAEKLAAATVAELLINTLPTDDSERARMLQLFKNIYSTITPTPAAPVTDAFQRKILDIECVSINATPAAQMTAHRAALPVSATAPRVNGATFGLASPPAGHLEKRIYTPYYAAPGELVTIQFPAALTGLNLDVRVSHLRSAEDDETSYTVMPDQQINFAVTTGQVQVANPHGGLIQIIVPDSVTWSGTQNITVTGAVQAPYFKLGTTTDAQWVAGIRARGTPFGVLDSDEATLVVDADKWLRTLADPEAVIAEWNYFCGKNRQFYVYNPGRQLPVHHDYYSHAGVSTYPQTYGLGAEITNSLDLKSSAYSLALHEYGHICDPGNIQFAGFSETSPNLGGKWIQRTERNYSWKEALTIARINLYQVAQDDPVLWTAEAHHTVNVKVVPFDLLSAEFGPAMIQQCVAAMRAMPAIPTSQDKIDEWARQVSNRTGFNMSAFFACWKLNVSASVQSELSSKPNWMPVERLPKSLTVTQGTPAIFANPSSTDFSYDGGLTLTNVSQPGSGTISNNGNGTYTYTPAAGFTGSTSFTYTVTNATGNVFTTTVPVKVVAAANDPKLTAFDGVAKGGTWTTVTLPKTYNSMVVVAQPAVGAEAPPMVARIRNASGSSFQVRLDRLDDSATPVGTTSVRFLVAEEGVYNEATHGIKMEAVKFTSATTDRKGDFTGTTRNFAYTGYDHYFLPAVFGQVMTTNDDRWSAFWYLSDENSVQVGKHVGEDTVTTRANETIGYIVMESGNYQFGSEQIQVGLTFHDHLVGIEHLTNAGASYDFTRFPALHSAQLCACVEAIDSNLDGFVSIQRLAGGNTLSAYLAEDSIGDAETVTNDVNCSYLLVHHSDGSPVAKIDQLVALSARNTLIKVLANDEVSGSPTVQVAQQPAYGVVTAQTDGTLIYTSNAGFTGSDAFAYTVTNAQGSSTSIVNLQLEAAGTSQAGIKADQFNGITGSSVANLTSSPNFPSNPSSSAIWSSFNSSQSIADNYGRRVYGYVVPPVTGDYTFWIASDDSSQLFLSTGFTSANTSMICYRNGSTGYQNWEVSSTQKSAVISLQAGRAYYLEALQKEGAGGDHVSVAWQGPGFARKVLGNPDIFTQGNTAPTLVAAPSDVSMNEGATTQVDLAGVFANTDVGDSLTIEVSGNTRPDIVGTSIVGNTLTLSQTGFETGSAVITLRAYDRTNTLVITSFTVTIIGSGSDSDGDGLADAWEIQYFGNLTAQNGSGDPDGDGFTNGLEFELGTDPSSAASQPSALYAGLRAWWKLDEISGTVADDTTGRAQDGTLLNGATWVTGITGGGVSLNGTNQSVQVPALSFSASNATISAWVKRNGAQTQWAGLVFERGSATGLDITSNNELRYRWNDTSITYNFGSGLVIPDNTWTFCAVVVEPTTATLYMQAAGGAMQSAVNNVAHASHTFNATAYLGQDSIGGRFFKGSLDDARIYARALSAAEIGQVYESANPPHAPVFTSNPVAKPAATEDAAYTGSTLAGSATDADAGDTLSFSKVSGPAWLSVAVNGALSGTPTNGNVGANSFTVRVTDAGGLTADATLNISVTNVNDAPVFGTLANANATEDAAYSGTLAGSASDADTGDTLTFSKVSGPSWLSVASNGDISGAPLNGNVGANNFVLRVTDAAGATADSSLLITVANVNDAPAFGALANANATEDSAFSGNIASAANDVDAGDTLTFSKVSGPAWLSVAANGALSGTPTNANVGPNSFAVRVTDTAGATATATLNINVANVNDAPAFTSNPINLSATEDSAFSGQLAATDIDAGDTRTFSKVSGPAWLTVSGSGALSGTPSNSAVGANAFTVRVTDAAGSFANATLNITVANSNDAPVFTVDPILAADASEGVAYTGQTLAGSAADADAGDTIAYSKVSGPAWLNVATNGALTGTPPSGSAGLHTFVVRVTDSGSATDDAELRINVGGLPLPWDSVDIGTGMLAGSASHSTGTFTQAGSGALGGTSDKLRFTYQSITGDGEIIARISSLQDTGNSSRVGVMFRESLAANSRQVFMGLTSNGNYRWVRRSGTGGNNSTSNSSTGTVPNTWVRIVRSGNTVTAYKSSNGTSWATVGSTTATLGINCYVGLAVSSGSNTTLNTSQFSNVTVTP